MELKPSDSLVLKNIGRALARAKFEELTGEEVLALSHTISKCSEISERIDAYFNAAKKAAEVKEEPAKPGRKKRVNKRKS